MKMNNNFEILFWKVYRNSYLNFKIYEQLNQDITDEFLTSTQIHIDNRMKFNDIYSFDWMVKSDQFELLKYKINLNQHIEFTNTSLCILFNSRIPYSKSKLDQIKSILDLLLKQQQQRNDYGIDYSSLLWQCLYINCELLEILLKYQENDIGEPLFQISSKIFEYATSNCKPIIIEMLIHSIQNSKSSDIKQLVNDYILGQVEKNKKLEQQQQQRKKQPLTYHYGIDSSKDMVKFSGYMDFIDLTSIISKELLLEYFDIYYKCTQSHPDKSIIQKKIDEILLLPSLQVEKQLFKLLVLVTKSKKLYSFYYFKYYEIIDTDETFGELNSIPFKKLPSNGVLSKLDNLISNQQQEKNEMVIEFLESFLSKFNFKLTKLKKNSTLINRLMDLIFDVMGDNKELYEKTINTIRNVNKRFSNYLPLQWNANMKSILIKDLKIEIQDKETIDWLSYNTKPKTGDKYISNCIGPIYRNKRTSGLISFSNIQLKEYAIIKLYGKNDQSHKFQPIKWSQILNNPLLPLFSQFGINNDTIIDEQYQSKSNDSTFNLLLYLTNDNGINKFEIGQNQFEFRPNLIKHFLTSISKLEPTISINLSNNYLNEVYELLFKSIINNDLNLSKILFNSVKDPLSFIQFSFDRFKIYIDNSNLKRMVPSERNIITNVQPEKSIEFIQLLINLKIKHGLVCVISTSFFNKLINHLFKSLIQTSGTTIYQIKQMELIIVENGITLEHSSFHSFYYLFIKSKKVMKFIHSIKSMIETTVINNDHQYCPCRGRKSSKVSKIIPFSNLIDQNVFTFEYLFGPNGRSFNELLQYFTSFKLEFIKSKNIKPKESSDFVEYLLYFLDINRFDLFFQHLEINIHLKSFIFSNKFIFTNLLKRLIPSNFHGNQQAQQQQQFNTISKFIELVDSVEIVAVYQLLLCSIKLYRSDIISFIINQYKIDKITIPSPFYPDYYNYPMIEYIFINHPTFDVSSIVSRMNIPFTPCALPFFKLLYNYIPNYKSNLFLNNNNLVKALEKKDFKLLDYFYSIGHLDRRDNNIYSLKK